MSDIIVHEEQILKAEEARVTLRNNLRSQGIECWDDETIDSLASKVANIQSYNKLLDTTISGKIYDTTATDIVSSQFKNNNNINEVEMTEIIKVPSSCFDSCSNLETVNIPKATNVDSGAFQYCYSLETVNIPLLTTGTNNTFLNCVSLKEIHFPNMTIIGGDMFRNCSALKILDCPQVVTISNTNSIVGTSMRIVNLPRFYGSNNGSCYSNQLQLADLGETQGFTSFNGGNSPYFNKLILRRTNTITPLSATSIFNNTPFASGGGKLYVPQAQITNYENATNWSALAGLTVLSLEGSRFEDLDWFEDYNSKCTLDGNEIEVLDNETVAIFKHTENIEHVYENGIELQDTELVKDRTLTSTI